MLSECSRLPSKSESNSCDPMRRSKNNTLRLVNRFWSGENLRDGAGRCAGAPGRCGMARGTVRNAFSLFSHRLSFDGFAGNELIVVTNVTLPSQPIAPILTRGGGGRDASRASHNRSHLAPGNFIAMAASPGASRLRREADFRGPKKEGRGRDCLIATNRRTPARLTTAGSTNIHIL